MILIVTSLCETSIEIKSPCGMHEYFEPFYCLDTYLTVYLARCEVKLPVCDVCLHSEINEQEIAVSLLTL